ncbi:MAG: hypothetical protein E7452_05050 [Ruminococcaceae bacterium]|nr:hypothetical protein [Oscillospiraceae bacterium]MBQ4047238.1 hypothetical protein [Clostridia bacterium]
MTYGKTTWLIGDGYWDSHSNGLFNSHESVCVLNTSDKDATITMTLYFEDRDEMGGFVAKCGAKRTHHIRMDKLISQEGKAVPQDVPYAILVESDVPVVVQYSRLMSSQPELGLMSTIAYPVE